jgi:hypothetical protein
LQLRRRHNPSNLVLVVKEALAQRPGQFEFALGEHLLHL